MVETSARKDKPMPDATRERPMRAATTSGEASDLIGRGLAMRGEESRRAAVAANAAM